MISNTQHIRKRRKNQLQGFDSNIAKLILEEDKSSHLSVIIKNACKLLKASDAFMIILENNGLWLKIWIHVSTKGMECQYPSDAGRFPILHSLNGEVFRSGCPIYCNDVQNSLDAHRDWVQSYGVMNTVIAPIKIGKKKIGTLSLQNSLNGKFDTSDVEILSFLANQAGVNIQNTILLEQLILSRNRNHQRAQELQDLLARNMQVQESERKRIATDIHDGVISLLSGTLREVEAWERNFENSRDSRIKFSVIKRLLNDVEEEARAAIYDLWPSILDYLGLVPALEQLVNSHEERTGIQCKLHVFGKNLTFKPEARIAIYRIVQEAINNAAIHAEASLVDVSLNLEHPIMRLSISDDGKGFAIKDYVPARTTCNFGLISMKERAQALGGNCFIRSQPGNGCQVVVEIPAFQVLENYPIEG